MSEKETRQKNIPKAFDYFDRAVGFLIPNANVRAILYLSILFVFALGFQIISARWTILPPTAVQSKQSVPNPY